MIPRASSRRLLVLIGLVVVLTFASAGLFKVALEAVLPASQTLRGLVHLTPVDATPEAPLASYRYDLGRAARRYLLVVTIVVFVAGRRSIPWAALFRRAFRRRAAPSQLLFGAATALAVVALYGLLLVACGRAGLRDPTAWELAAKLPQYVVGALFVGLLEEGLFRAALMRSLLRDHGVWSALLGSSALFAVLHCIGGSYRTGLGFEPAVGLRLLHAFVTDPDGSLVPTLRAVIGLFLLGLALAYLYLRSGSLWAPIGLHAGVVCFSRLLKKLVGPAEALPDWVLGEPRLFLAGVVTWALLLALLWALTRIAPRGPLYCRLTRRPSP